VCYISNDKIQFNTAYSYCDLRLATEKKGPGFYFLVLEVLVFVIEKDIFILIGCFDSCLVIFLFYIDKHLIVHCQCWHIFVCSFLMTLLVECYEYNIFVLYVLNWRNE
jgi:hypothetical protein